MTWAYLTAIRDAIVMAFFAFATFVVGIHFFFGDIIQ